VTEPELSDSTGPTGRVPESQRYRLHGVERALDTLELLAAAGPGGMTLTELAEQIAVSKSSAVALLQTLIARGFVADSGARLTRRYRLGMALAKLGDAAEVQSPLVSLTMPVLRSVTDATGLTTRLVIPDGAYAIVTARIDAPGTVQFASYLRQTGVPALHVRRQGAAGRAPARSRAGAGRRDRHAVPDRADDHRSRCPAAGPGAEYDPRLHDR